jgi:hypothetical protein
MLNRVIRLVSIALASTAMVVPAVNAQVKLPPTLTMTAYDTGTAGFNITVGIGKMMKDKFGTDVRVLPAGNDVARLQPVRTGRAIAAGMGSGVYFAQEGVFEFGSREWGPQPVQITLTTVDCNGGNLGVAGDIGVKTMADLKGKRIGFVVGSPALNQNALAMLAFAGNSLLCRLALQHAGIDALRSLITAQFAAALGQRVEQRRQQRFRASPIHQQRLCRAADAGATQLRIQNDIARHLRISVAIHIDMAQPFQMTDHRHPRLGLHTLDQTAPTTRHDHIDLTIQPTQHHPHGGPVGSRHELNRRFRQPCLAQPIE